MQSPALQLKMYVTNVENITQTLLKMMPFYKGGARIEITLVHSLLHRIKLI